MDRLDQQKRKRKSGDALMRELQNYERQGTLLYLNDRRSRADEIVNAFLLAEHSEYMRDFISDDAERITEIHFIRIPEKNED